MKVISILEPWASLIAIGAKEIETRSWPTKSRGPLAIHASKSTRPHHLNLAWNEPFFSALDPIKKDINGKVALGYSPGCIIAVCNLVDCIKISEPCGPLLFLEGEKIVAHLGIESNEFTFGDYTPGRYAWIIEDIRKLPEPIHAKGRLGLWEFDVPVINP